MRRLPVLVSLAACAASGPTPDQVIARHRAAAEARLDALADAGRAVAAVPPIRSTRTRSWR